MDSNLNTNSTLNYNYPELEDCCNHSSLTLSAWFWIGFKVCLTAWTIVSNSLVLLAIIVVPSLRKPHNYLLFSLALSDLFVALLVAPMLIYLKINCDNWPISSTTIMCDLWISVDVMCCSASIFNMTGIAIDRYIAITAPMSYKVNISTRKTILGGIVAWIAAGVVTLPTIHAFGNQHRDSMNPNLLRCYLSENPWCHLISVILAFLIPLLLTIFTYGKIIRIVSQKKRSNIVRNLQSTSTSSTGTKVLNDVPQLQPLKIENSRKKCLIRRIYNEHKGTAILGSLMIAFIVCWTPFFVFTFLRALSQITGWNLGYVPFWIEDIFLWLGYSNSAINPFLLCVLFKEFRVAFWEILCCRCFSIAQTMRANNYNKQIRNLSGFQKSHHNSPEKAEGL